MDRRRQLEGRQRGNIHHISSYQIKTFNFNLISVDETVAIVNVIAEVTAEQRLLLDGNLFFPFPI